MGGIEAGDDGVVIREGGGGERWDQRFRRDAVMSQGEKIGGVIALGVIVAESIERNQQDVRFVLLRWRIKKMRGLAEARPEEQKQEEQATSVCPRIEHMARRHKQSYRPAWSVTTRFRRLVPQARSYNPSTALRDRPAFLASIEPRSSRRTKTTRCPGCRGAAPRTGDLAIEKLFESGEWIVRCHAVSIGARAHYDAQLLGGLNWRHACDQAARSSRRPAPACAADSRAMHRSNARWTSADSPIGTSLFTRSKMSSKTPTESSRGQCMVMRHATLGGPARDLVVFFAFGLRLGLLLLFMAQVMRSPMPLKRSMRSPKPIGNSWVKILQLFEFAAWRDAAQGCKPRVRSSRAAARL